MQSGQQQRIEAYRRVQSFLAAHPLTPPADYGEPKQLLDQAVAQLEDHGTAQVEGNRLKRAGLQNEQTLRRVLREQHLKPITQIARARLKGSPGIDKALFMPKTQLPTTQLLNVAEAFRNAVAPYEATFVQSGRPADFLAQLEAATQALKAGADVKAGHLGSQIGAGAGLDLEIARGSDAIQMLDAIVRTSFAGQLDVLAEWRNARRIRTSTGRRSKAVSGSSSSGTTAGGATTTASAGGAASAGTGSGGGSASSGVSGSTSSASPQPATPTAA